MIGLDYPAGRSAGVMTFRSSVTSLTGGAAPTSHRGGVAQRLVLTLAIDRVPRPREFFDVEHAARAERVQLVSHVAAELLELRIGPIPQSSLELAHLARDR